MTTLQFPQRKVEVGGGLIAVPCQELMRYSHFFITFSALDISEIPGGVRTFVQPGLDIFKQCNDAVAEARRIGADWLWIIGDDHFFFPDIVMRLISHDLDVVVPNCLQRSAPFNPVIYSEQDANGQYKTELELPQKGVHKVHAAGSAGMLISKRVIDAVPSDPFNPQGKHLNEDLEFCRRVREAGFTIHCDVEALLAHIGTMVVWPQWMGEHGWNAALDIGPPNEDGSPQRMPVRRLLKGPALTAA